MVKFSGKGEYRLDVVGTIICKQNLHLIFNHGKLHGGHILIQPRDACSGVCFKDVRI